MMSHHDFETCMAGGRFLNFVRLHKGATHHWNPEKGCILVQTIQELKLVAARKGQSPGRSLGGAHQRSQFTKRRPKGKPQVKRQRAYHTKDRATGGDQDTMFRSRAVSQGSWADTAPCCLAVSACIPVPHLQCKYDA